MDDTYNRYISYIDQGIHFLFSIIVRNLHRLLYFDDLYLDETESIC